jgi:hypothetical protein
MPINKTNTNQSILIQEHLNNTSKTKLWQTVTNQNDLLKIKTN